MSFILLGILNSQAQGGVPAPAFLSSAPLWLDAADDTTITESGGSVSQWDNKGTLENVSQATSADQPTTGVSTQNGLNVIDFADSSLLGATKSQWTFMHDGTTYFIAAAFKPTTGEDAWLTNTFRLSSNNIGAAIAGLRNFGNRTTVFVARGVQSSVSVDATIDPYPADEYSIFSALIDPDNGTAADRAELFENDGSAVKTNTETNTPSTSVPTADLEIGGGSTPVTMSLAELIVVSGADATETNRQTVVDYLNTKWGIF